MVLVKRQNHRHQGLARVACASGMGSKTLRRMVHQDRFPGNHFDPSSKRQLITINKEALARILPDQAAYIDLHNTARLLGLKRSRLRQLIAHGAILADAKPDFARSNHWHLQRSAVFGLLEDLRRGSVGISIDAGAVTLNHALHYWRVSAAKLGALIRTAKQQGIQYGLAVADRLTNMRFRESRLTSLAPRCARRHDDLGVHIAGGRTAWLERTGSLRAGSQKFSHRRCHHKKWSRHPQDCTTKPPTIRRNTYVAVSDLAKQRNTSSRSLLRQIAIRPVTGPDIDGARQYFFKRADLATGKQDAQCSE